jgi:hypothetical protein
MSNYMLFAPPSFNLRIAPQGQSRKEWKYLTLADPLVKRDLPVCYDKAVSKRFRLVPHSDFDFPRMVKIGNENEYIPG